jgi:phosphatidate cytidylyltransferase
MTELQRRVLVAAVAIPLTVAVVYLGDAPLAAFLGMIAALGAREFFPLVRSEGVDPFATAGIVLAAAAPLLVHAGHLGLVRVPYEFLVLLALIFMGFAVWVRGPGGRPVSAVAVTLFGVIYAGGTLCFAYALRYHDYAVGSAAGTALLFFPVLLTWACDTAAYSVGRKMGRRKLMPAVSPGKTVEGAAAGVVFTIIISVVYVNVVLRPVAQLSTSLTSAVLFGLLVAVGAQVGDLAESMIKRSAGVKDSSALLPGHGGVLDRLDSLYFVLPLAFWLLNSMLVAAPRAQ